MINAAEYRAMAWEHHRLAGMCRSPDSREQHFRLEEDFLALAASEECLHGTRAAQHPSHSGPPDSMHCASSGYDTAHLAHLRSALAERGGTASRRAAWLAALVKWFVCP